MNTDRELLEAAAKAAGYIPGETFQFHPAYGRSIVREATDKEWVLWNPLTDNDDAFRLIVTLDMSSLMIFSTSSRGKGKRREFWTPNSGYDGGKSATTEDEYAADPYAATRRAIVRAAAAIVVKQER